MATPPNTQNRWIRNPNTDDGGWIDTWETGNSPSYFFDGDPNVAQTGGTGGGTKTPQTGGSAVGTPYTPPTGTGGSSTTTTSTTIPKLSDNKSVLNINETAKGTLINGGHAKYKMDADGVQADTAQVGTTAQAGPVDPRDAATYTAQQTQQNVAQNGQATAQQGTVSQDSLIDPNEVPQIDMKGTATGVNEDGTTNYTGQALNQYAEQDLNAVDPKATLKGQLDILQGEFQNANGEPIVPMWAQAAGRSVSRIAAFKGMTGTAATAALSQAMMEASIDVAKQDASFYQTLTIQNLNNKQAMTINKANVLAKMDQINVDNRMAAAIENSKKFMEMDLANLDNRQQAEIVNTQARVQSILEDAKAVNTQRMFTADSQNNMAKFYDELNANIDMYNSSQLNEMSRFNVDQKNAQNRFNADMENNREQFYKNMQFEIDTANAKWRQTVTLAESQMKFEAAATDVKNMVGISVEEMNQIWDRQDAILDYIWKSSENELDRKHQLSLTKLQGKLQGDLADKQGFGSLLGSITGAVVGSDQFLDWLF